MQHLIYWVMKVRASCGVWIRWQWRYFLRMVQTSEGEELRSRCSISLLPPCYQRTTATENPCPSFSLNNFCATTKEDQILTLLLFFFHSVIIFILSPPLMTEVTEMKSLVQRFHWKNEEAIQKLGRNGWIERKENAPQPCGYISWQLSCILMYICPSRTSLRPGVLLLSYYCNSCQAHDRCELQRGEDKNTKSFFMHSEFQNGWQQNESEKQN